MDYATYHLLREPKTTIDKGQCLAFGLPGNMQIKKWWEDGLWMVCDAYSFKIG